MIAPLPVARAAAMAVGGGILLGLTFKFTWISWFAWFALIPLFYLLVREKTLHSVLYSFIFGTAFVLVQAAWLLSIDAVSPLLMLFAWSMLALYQGLFFAIFALLYKGMVERFYDRKILWVAATASLFMAMHSARTEGVFGFPFGSLASSQKDLNVLQSVSIWGEFGLTYLMVVFSLIVLRSAISLDNSSTRRLQRQLLSIAVSIFAVNYLAGIMMNNPSLYLIPEQRSNNAVEIAMVQPSIAQNMKMDPRMAEVNKELLLKLSAKAIEENRGLDILIWPETSTPISFNEDAKMLMLVSRMTSNARVELIAGSFNQDGARAYNAAYHFSDSGQLKGIYNKMKLVPFSEFLPLRSLLQPTGIFNYSPGDLTPGREHKIFKTERADISVVICYESLTSEITREMVLKGAKAIFVLTNDAWFHRTNELQEHLQGSKLRAIENRRFIVQSANTGVTAVVDPRGELTSLGSIEKSEVVHGVFVPVSERSFFTNYGYLLPFVNLLLLAMLLLWSQNKSKTRE